MGIPVAPNNALTMGGICIINGRFRDMVIYMVSELFVGGARCKINAILQVTDQSRLSKQRKIGSKGQQATPYKEGQRSDTLDMPETQIRRISGYRVNK